MRKRFLPFFPHIPVAVNGITGCSSQNEPTTGSFGNQDQTSYNVNPSGTDSEKNDNLPDGENDSTPSGEQTDSDSDVPAVYMTTDISPEGLMAIYKALGCTPTGKVAVKLSTGEPPASNYLRPELIKDLVQSIGGTIVECNTAYGGSRSGTAMHYQVAKDHGFTDIANFQILYENGSMTLTVNGGSVLKENYVGAAFGDYDSYVVLSHFKGHSMAGYGGAIKNISIGLASSEGKAWIHSGGTDGSVPVRVDLSAVSSFTGGSVQVYDIDFGNTSNVNTRDKTPVSIEEESVDISSSVFDYTMPRYSMRVIRIPK